MFCSNVRDLGCFCFKNIFLEIQKLRFFLGATINKNRTKRRQQAAFASACSLFFNRGTEGKGFSDDGPWNMLTFWTWIKAMLQVFRDNTFFFFTMINSVKNKQTFQEEPTNLCLFPMHVMFVNKFSWKTWKFNKQQTWCHSRLLELLLSNRNHQISTDTDLTSSSDGLKSPGAEALVSATRWKNGWIDGCCWEGCFFGEEDESETSLASGVNSKLCPPPH